MTGEREIKRRGEGGGTVGRGGGGWGKGGGGGGGPDGRGPRKSKRVLGKHVQHSDVSFRSFR